MNGLGSDLGAGDNEHSGHIPLLQQQQIEQDAYQSGLSAAWEQYKPEISTNNPDGMYVDPNAVNNSSYTGASDVLADIHRNQWQDWKDRFQPRLEQLAGYAESGELTTQGVQLAGDAVQQSFTSTTQNQQRSDQGLGIQRTGAQQKASKRTMGLELAASKVGARNKARIAGQDRDMKILAGGGGLQMADKK